MRIDGFIRRDEVQYTLMCVREFRKFCLCSDVRMRETLATSAFDEDTDGLSLGGLGESTEAPRPWGIVDVGRIPNISPTAETSHE